MSFDARSRERLEALGRRLPTRLPMPGAGDAPPGAPAAAASPGEGRHRLELEQDPDQLFRELMAASPDGSIPPHHLERLRQLEQQRQRPAASPLSAERGGSAAAAPPAQRQPGQRQQAQRPAVRGQLQRPGRPLDPEQQQAYTAFQQLLLEGDE